MVFATTRVVKVCSVGLLEQGYVGLRRALRQYFFFSSRRRHTRYWRDWSSDVCSSDLALGRMERNARSLLEMVNDMLEYSRLEAGQSALHIETLEVKDALEEVAALFEPEAREKKIVLRVETDERLGRVRTDRRKLAQVVSCLVSNALKFTSSGSVTVSAGAAEGDRWYMEVTDTGIGISSDALAYIFDRFRQVDDRLTRSYNGVGLGLAITRRIVELLEGEITVETKQNEGSRFRVTWPREARPRTGTGSLVMQQQPSKPSATPEDAQRRLRAV